MKTITTKEKVKAVVLLPGSKSLTHRALITAALAEGPSLIERPLLAADTNFTRKALERMGINIIPSTSGEGLAIEGCGGRLPPYGEDLLLFLGNSGTSMRLLLSAAALGSGGITLDGTPRMRERPIAPLVKALEQMGTQAAYLKQNGCPPVHLAACGLKGGTIRISGGQSSQYLSSILLAAPYARSRMKIQVEGTLRSQPYVDLTLSVMEEFGVEVLRQGYRTFTIPPGQNYRGCSYRVEPDVSSASYFWAAAALTGGSVTTPGIRPEKTRQGDIALLELLAAMGCRVERAAAAVTVTGGRLQGLEADMSAMPDMVPTLAALAPFAAGRTVIRNVPHLRYKESDRLQAVAEEWRRLGARVDELADGLVIPGGQELHGSLVDPHDDHRLAMSLAVMGLRVPGVRIKTPECVDKSFPGFWPLFDAL